MPRNNKIDRPTLIFPEATAYSIDEVLNFISVVIFPVDFDLNNVDRNTAYRKEYKSYLVKRLFEAVIEKKFNLWDASGTKIIAPPIDDDRSLTKAQETSSKQSNASAYRSHLKKTASFHAYEVAFVQALKMASKVPSPQEYKTVYWWAKMGSILRDDLVIFFNEQRIGVIFEDEPTVNHDADTVQKKTASSNETITEPEDNQTTHYTQVDCQPEQQSAINIIKDASMERESPQAGLEKKCSLEDKHICTSESINENLPKDNQADKIHATDGQGAMIISNCLPAKKKKKGNAANKPKLTDDPENFDNFPDSKYVDVKMVAYVLGCGTATVWRRAKNGQLVAPHYPGTRTTRWLVGELRQWMKTDDVSKSSGNK